MLDILTILVALGCGIASRWLGLPALVGYLAAGFLLHEVAMDAGPLLKLFADLGITLLLFTIGLKLNVRELLKMRIWGSALSHMLLMQLLFTGLLVAAGALLPALALAPKGALIVAFALTFSSTVLVIQTMQDKGEMASRHAGLAIGILIIQDLAAVTFLAASTGQVPQWSALGLLLLWPLRGTILRLLARCGHGELFTLAGFALALGSYQLFELVGIKGDLGALIAGAILAGHQKSKELARNLLNFKDLFLVGFFLSIGLDGWPQRDVFLFAIFLGLTALLKPLFFFPIMTRLHVPPRTALLASSALTNHSEFGLIVVALAATSGWIHPHWDNALSISIAVSFVLAPLLNQRVHDFYLNRRERLLSFETSHVRASLPDTTDTRIIVLGMGNIGTGAYDGMAEQHGGEVLGVDENEAKLDRHRTEHRRVVNADASDPEFWLRLDLHKIELIMLALTNHQENLLVSRLLDRLGYRGRIAAVVRFAEEADELEQHGISAFNLYAQAGAGFAAHAADRLDP
jgi:glutathione-regulated potassium-efflux system ancillary protein KefC